MRKLTTEQKDMQGTLRPSREVNSGLTHGTLAIIPRIPEGWPPETGTIWRTICTELKRTGYLTRAFMPLVRDYVWAVYEQEVAREKLMEFGFIEVALNAKGLPNNRLSVWHDLQERAFKRQIAAGKELGLSPNMAHKIPAIKKEVSNEESLLN